MAQADTHSRRQFLTRAGAAAAAASVAEVLAATRGLQGPTGPRQPVLFIGHGSPMNALADNRYTRMLAELSSTLTRPRAILVVSAHWLTPGRTLVGAQSRPPTIHDFGGFPKALSEMRYPAPGHPELAAKTVDLMPQASAALAYDWGLDHGTWCVLARLFPAADIPVFQVSIDYAKPAEFHVALGRELAQLREEGVLILGSGNIVHNLRQVDRLAGETNQATQAWAEDFDAYVAQALHQGDLSALVSPRLPASVVRSAVPTPDHYFPLLYAVGAGKGDVSRTVHEGFQSGTLSMRAVQFG